MSKSKLVYFSLFGYCFCFDVMLEDFFIYLIQVKSNLFLL